jgi:alkylation response protein AidB-like acyl-CoA dehydrogenase
VDGAFGGAAPMSVVDLPTDVAGFRRGLVEWLDAHHDELRPAYHGHPDVEDELSQFQRVKRALFDAGWGRLGWPESLGGAGGSPMLRAVVGEEVAIRDIAAPGLWSMIEVLAPTVITFGTPALIAEMIPPLLRGDETWCQGFSEPGSGSDLASLSCRATPADDGWVINGQKVWTSYANLAERCVLLTRTGEPGSAHRGITAFFVDVDTPGITARPIEIQNGNLEFCEVFFDDVHVPTERMLGSVGQGWQIAMDVLPYERSTSFWHRGAYLLGRMDALVAQVAAGDPAHVDAKLLGEAYQGLVAFRCRSRATQFRIAANQDLGSETSIDKILVATAEQQLFDAVRDLLPGVVEFGTDEASQSWRWEYLYSRAATIYGGTAEVQRNIVARRLLDMGAER